MEAPDAVLPVAGPATTSGALVSRPGILGGGIVNETGAAVARIRLWDNASSAAGTLLFAGSLPANGAIDASFNRGRRFSVGLYLEVVSGAVQVSVAIP